MVEVKYTYGNVKFEFECYSNNCPHQEIISIYEILEIGTPYCTKCGEEMILSDHCYVDGTEVHDE